MKNPYIIPAAMISAAIWVGFWMLKPPPQPPDISIHKAANTGNIEAVKQHLAAGTDVNAKDRDGWTPLLYAALHGFMEIAELLIGKGADVNAKDDGGDTPLDFAIICNHPETADILRKHGGKHGTIHGAAGGGDVEAVRELLAAGANVNAWDAFGGTPLDMAIKWNNQKITDHLRKHGGKTGEELKAEGK